ncbi:substrate-binding domain-containing protein [uncultured Polaribacter sp.]|uniref:hybrid sensor histidine kinase/response regulator transcription factor n=1 Tax=uncultured Polaribacter sp. TaxID=174711 RepID=UPI002610E892|nr:substrate-binding domain-containing protein [uncultured Polaribacter sp.]
MFKLKALLFFIVLFSFISCSKEVKTKRYKIGFSQTGHKDDWRKAMNQSMEIQAALNPEIELIILEGDDDIKNQIKDIEQLINDEVDVLIVSPVKSKPITPIVEKAFRSGIPVLIVDRKIDGNNYTAYLGGDNYQVGVNAANYLASISESKKNIIEIKGLFGSSPALERSLGFNNIVKKNKNLEVIKTIEGNWESFSIKDSLRVILEENNNIDFVFSHNDRMALGAWEVAKEMGLQNSLKFIGVDGLPGEKGGIKLVQDGVLLATILYPTGGDEAVKLALKILKDENIDKNNSLNTTVIDSRNADIMKNQFDKIYQQQQDIENQQLKILEQEKTYTTQNITLKLLLALLVISVLLATFSIYSRFKLGKKKRELEIQNNKITVQRNQIKKINEAKTNFFTGLSHEFKTPITLILSSIDSLSENKAIRDNKLLKEVGLIFNNSKRLLRLINQLIDFRKIEDKKFILRASKTNLYQFSNTIFKDFEREAQKRNIKFTLNTNNEYLDIYLDRNLMDKVYFNLLSNSFKFTPNNGFISINIEEVKNSNFVKIYFKDSGIGIPKNEIDNVFKAFYQGSNNNKTSSGIGLHLSKEFIELHKGSIEVNSDSGIEFVITLYKDNVHLSSDEIVFEPAIIDSPILSLDLDYEDDAFTVQSNLNIEDRDTILIVEDNVDLVKFLNNKLSLEYNVQISNGDDVLEKTFDLIPDIIICDVNLPEKDGFEICQILKKDIRTSHIPLIILTAYDSKESYIKGLDSGADLFLTKPFSFSILYRSLKNLLYNRDKLRKHYIKNIYKKEQNQKSDLLEQDFLDLMNKYIYENLDDSSFSVEQLAGKLNISRVQLYRKIKAILNVSISDYILNIRLEKAKVLLLESKLTISEIAYSVGFSSPSYFSSTYKNKFGKTPKSYKKN